MLGNRRLYLIGILIFFIVLGVVWFFYGQDRTDQEDIESFAKQAAEETAKSENPFRAENPLSEVEVDPFEKTKKVLNPFEN